MMTFEVFLLRNEILIACTEAGANGSFLPLLMPTLISFRKQISKKLFVLSGVVFYCFEPFFPQETEGKIYLRFMSESQVL